MDDSLGTSGLPFYAPFAAHVRHEFLKNFPGGSHLRQRPVKLALENSDEYILDASGNHLFSRAHFGCGIRFRSCHTDLTRSESYPTPAEEHRRPMPPRGRFGKKNLRIPGADAWRTAH